MPKIIFTDTEIKNYFKGEVSHHFKDKTIEIAEQMAVHANGVYPKDLLEERRPNEPLEVKEYREKIWIPITKPTFSKVFSSLQKIRRSQDWSIMYEGDFPRISEEEALEEYCESKFPYFTSVTNWVFSILLRKYIIDPNAVVFVFPLESVIAENEYLKPFPVIFDSINIIDYKEEDYAVLENPLGTRYMDNGREYDGKSFYVITTEEILKYDQTDLKETMKLTAQYSHNLEMLPVFKLGGILIDQKGNEFLYESRLAGIIPELDEAVREYSDLQAAKVLHIYPERWEYTNNECSACKGSGHRPNPNFNPEVENSPSDLPCENPYCSNGYVVSGPYSKILVKPINNATENGGQIPTPPAGYVEKDVEIVKLQDEGVDKHIFKALASINFEFLFNTPLNQSGVAKEVDKDELNNTVHSIAEDVVRIMDIIYRATARYRYKELYPLDEIETMLPQIPVPERFDLLSSTHTRDELKEAKLNKTNPVLTNAIEIDYAAKRFGSDPGVRDRLMLILELDPLPNVGDDEKMTRLSNKGITLETYIVSSNIHEFVQAAIDENEKFVDMSLKEQKLIIRKYAKDQIAEDSAAGQVMNGVNDGNNGLDEINNPDDKTVPVAIPKTAA